MKCLQCGSSRASFGLTFFDTHCSACVTHAEMFDTDLMRENQAHLRKIFDDEKRAHKGTYHCLVPIRGDAEDYHTLDYLLKSGLNPLVVHVNNFFQNEIGWTNAHNLITFFDVDSVSFSPNYTVYKDLVAAALRKLKSIYVPYKGIQHAYVMRLAAEKKIPLVVWGQCQPIEFAGKFSRRDRLFQSKWWVSEHELNGISQEQFLGTGTGLAATKASVFKYPNRSEIAGVRAIFLSNFLPWDQVSQNRGALAKGFVPEQQTNTYDFYENSGSSVYYQLHDLLRIINCGFPKVHEHLSRDLRFKRICPAQCENVRNELDRYLAYDISSFFFKFLEVTTSGYQWFLEKRLGSLKYLLRSTPEKTLYDNIAPPREILESYPSSVVAEDDFVIYTKGI